MSNRENYERKTEEMLIPILKEHELDLYDVDYIKEAGNWYLRVYLDKEGGITVEDCALISRLLSDLLDEEDFIPNSYILEVSSPGLGRQLKKDKHFLKSIGESVEVKLFSAMNKQKDFEGILLGISPENITIQLENDETLNIERTNIAMIRLALDF